MKPFPALCKDCKWSATEGNRDWYLKCVHPIINAKDSWALSRATGDNNVYGSDAQRERANTGWFAKCGMKGKLWEAK
jgi:hypothetical protein